MNAEFHGSELRLARTFNGFALDELADRVEKTRQYLHKLEIGSAKPTEQLLTQLAAALQVNVSFFFGDRRSISSEDQFHFRKLFTTRAGVKQAVMARGELISRLVGYLDKELKLPDIQIPEVDTPRTQEDIEQAAELCRSKWELGLGPISHMSRLAENVGAVVTGFSSLSKDVDALSIALHRPIIVRNGAKESVCRQRFDIGHELGHVVLHKGIVTGDRTTESQAHRFASALLVPRAMMAKLFPKPRGSRLDWVGIREFKLTWKVSKAAILYRARQLDLLNDDQYKTGVITLRRTGEANGEREDHLIPPEQPELLARSFNVLVEKKSIYVEDVASALNFSHELLFDVIGFKALLRHDLDKGVNQTRPSLYLVK
jgi:Zn-dependent peptidase ImmA (M78 family)/DNA-binding XRE family transcriptional regulator